MSEVLGFIDHLPPPVPSLNSPWTQPCLFLFPIFLSTPTPTPTLEASRWLRSVTGANGYGDSLCYKSLSSLVDASRRPLFRMLSIIFIVNKPFQTVNKVLRAQGKGLSHVPSFSLKPSWQPHHPRETVPLFMS